MNRFVIASVLFLVACHNTPPEGVYPCRQATVAHDCPELWYCRRSDNLCWITDDPDGGMTVGDGGMPAVDAGPDAARDTGPHCTSETCNGLDDDCDGLVDEGVIAVGPAVVAIGSGTSLGGVLLTATTLGFGALGSGLGDSHIDWMTLDGSGNATSALSRVDATIYGGLDLLSSNDTIITAGLRDADSRVDTFQAGTPTALRSTLALSDVPGDIALPRIASFDGAHATIYAFYASGPTRTLWRVRADLSTPTASSSSSMLSTTVAGALSVAHTSTADYLLYVDSSLHLSLASAAADDGTAPFRTVGTVSYLTGTPTVTATALGIRDPEAPVSEMNPIAVTWASREGGVYFAEVSDTTSFSMGSPRVLPGALSPPRPFAVPVHPISIASLPDSSEHWIVAVMGSEMTDMTLAAAQVFEITSALTREVVVPGETRAGRAEISVAAFGSSIRMAETSAGGGIVTRSIGCE